ncbi:MAG: hypothetical protein OD811_06950 [Alphaproteobacteria bacterium]
MANNNESREDPAGLIKDAFAMGSEFMGPARDLFLGWVLRLEGIAVRDAALRLLRRYDTSAVKPETPLAELVALLEEAAHNPQPTKTKRRRGRSGRGARHTEN